ncbi:MAG: hypothetical protein WDZ65_14050, partial [Aquisalimonadaceae bacterium]
MRILVLSYYFEPDISAGCFRMTAFVRALRQVLPEGSRVDVLTTLPGRFSSFSTEAPELEDHGDLTIRRFRPPPHRRG